MKKLLKAYFKQKLKMEPSQGYHGVPFYPAVSVHPAAPAYPGESVGFAAPPPSLSRSFSRRGAAAPVAFGFAMAACLAVLVLTVPRPTALQHAATAAAERINTKETFPEGIRKIQVFFIRNFKPGGLL